MGDRLEARISAVEDIQEEFGHDIREIKERLTRLTSSFEDYVKTQTMLPRGQSHVPTQYVSSPRPRASVQTTSYLPRETHRPNLRQPIPTSSPAFRAISRPTNRPSDSRGNYSGQKTSKDNIQWDPIPLTYTELYPKLVQCGSLVPMDIPPMQPPYPRWYNEHVRCDYHSGNRGHSTEDCIALKRRVHDLIKAGALAFDDEDISNVNGMETACEALLKTDMLNKEQEKEEEKKTLQCTIRKLELMLKEQKEYAATLREEHHQQISRQGQTLKNDDV